MDFQKFPINQSLIKTFLHNGEERSYCLRSVYLTKIVRKLREEPSEAMKIGKYFESLTLGKSARGDYLNDLPRKKLTKKIIAENAVLKLNGKPLLKGEKYIHHIKIDEQIARFKALCKKYQIIITDMNVEVPILTVWDQDP